MQKHKILKLSRYKYSTYRKILYKKRNKTQLSEYLNQYINMYFYIYRFGKLLKT